MIADFFGSEPTPLLGCYHQPSSRNETTKSVLICPPIGHEYIRTHWSLRIIANQLARKGCDVLRFDYRGIGDSFGDPNDVTSLEQWITDVETAVQHLKQESGADSVMLLGLRAGSVFAAEVARRRHDINAIVAWEPVLSGRQYLRQLRSMHTTMIDLWYQKVETVSDDSYEELLGTKYRRELINDLQQWEIDWGSLEIPQLLIQSEDSLSTDNADGPPWHKRITVSDEDSWGKLSDLEVAWLRPKTSQLAVQSVMETFARLEEREMLTGAAG